MSSDYNIGTQMCNTSPSTIYGEVYREGTEYIKRFEHLLGKDYNYEFVISYSPMGDETIIQRLLVDTIDEWMNTKFYGILPRFNLSIRVDTYYEFHASEFKIGLDGFFKLDYCSSFYTTKFRNLQTGRKVTIDDIKRAHNMRLLRSKI